MTSKLRPGLPWILVLLIVGFFYIVRGILLPMVVAMTIAYLLNPWIQRIEVHGIRRRIAALGVFAVVLVAGYLSAQAMVQLMTRQANQALLNLPRVFKNANEIVRRNQLALDESAFGRSITRAMPSYGKTFKEKWWGYLVHLTERPVNVFDQIIPFLEFVLLVPFFTYFFMADGPLFFRKLLAIVPSRSVETVLHVAVQIDSILGNYVRGIVLQGLFLGIFTAIGFWWIDLDYAFQIAVWVATTSVIPLFGAVSAAILGSIAAFIQWGTLSGMVKVCVVAFGIRLLDEWLLHPLILKRAVHLHPLVTVFSLMVGGHLGGFWGLLFAVPSACVLKVLGHVMWEWYMRGERIAITMKLPNLRVPIV